MKIDFISNNKKTEKKDKQNLKKYIEWTDAEKTAVADPWKKKPKENFFLASIFNTKKDKKRPENDDKNSEKLEDLKIKEKQSKILKEVSGDKKNKKEKKPFFSEFFKRFNKKNKIISDFNKYSSDNSKKEEIKVPEIKPAPKKEEIKVPEIKPAPKKEEIKVPEIKPAPKKEKKPFFSEFFKRFKFKKKNKTTSDFNNYSLDNSKKEEIKAPEIKPAPKKEAEKNEIRSANFTGNEEEGKKWMKSKVIKTNLIGDGANRVLNFQKYIIELLIAIFLALIILLSAYFILDYYHQKIIAENINLSNEHRILSKNLDDQKNSAETAENFKNKLSLAKRLLENHIYWTNFFKFIEDNTLENISFSGFSGDTKGQYNLAAKAGDFYSIEQQVKQFVKNKYIKSVNVESANLFSVADGSNKNSADFNLKFEINNNIFKSFNLNLDDEN